MQYTLSLDAAYAAEWRISDDELMQSDFSTAVEMFERLHVGRVIEEVLRWMHGHCRIHWGYQLMACCRAFGVTPSGDDIIRYWYVDDCSGEACRFSECRLSAVPPSRIPRVAYR